MTDSGIDTREHIQNVWAMVGEFISLLQSQTADHDGSKFLSPEREILDDVKERLDKLVYGSDEYRACLADMKPMLDHHYAANRHHPEHFANGVNDMDLIDLV